MKTRFTPLFILTAAALLACPQLGRSQTYSPAPNGYTVNGSSVTGSGTNTTTAYFLDPTGKYSVVIQSGANLGNTTAQGNSNELEFLSGVVENNGTLSATDAGISFEDGGSVKNLGAITGTDYGIVENGNAAIHNSGTITGTDDAAIYSEYEPNGLAGAITTMNVVNTGSILSSDGDGIDNFNYYDNSTGGTAGQTININNSGLISTYGDAISVDGGAEDGAGSSSNTFVLNNTGTIISSNSDAVDVDELYSYEDAHNGSNFLSLSNSGTITGSGDGVYLEAENEYEGGSGVIGINISNNGTITGGTGYGLALEDMENYENAGNALIQSNVFNSGTIQTTGSYAVYTYTYNYDNGGNAVNVISLTNTGTITSANSEGIDDESYNYENEGNVLVVTNLLNTGTITAASEGVYIEAYNEDDGGNATSIQNITNTGNITSTANYALENYESGNYNEGGKAVSVANFSNSGTISGYEGGVYVYTGNSGNAGSGLSTIGFVNSGEVLATESGAEAVFLESFNDDSVNGNATTRLTFDNQGSGVINSPGTTVDILAPNSGNGGTGVDSSVVQFNNEGDIESSARYGASIQAGNTGSGGDATTRVEITNTGTIEGDLEGLTSTVTSGTVTGTSSSLIDLKNAGFIAGLDAGVDLENADATTIGAGSGQIKVYNSSTGVIESGDTGLYISNARTGPNYTAYVYNEGVIGGTTYGIDLNTDNATVIAAGGGIGGGSAAILLGGSQSTVTVQGRSEIDGVIQGSGNAGNVLNFNLIGMTQAEIAADKLAIAAAGGGAGTITAAGNTYDFDGFQAVNFNGRSFAGSVDSGLGGLGGKIDHLPLGSDYDLVYSQGALNPEATLNSLSGRQFLNAFQQIGLNNATEITALADNRAFQLRAGTAGIDLSGLNINPASMIASLGSTASVLGRLGAGMMGGTEMSDSKNETRVVAANGPRWGAWASGTVTFADESGSSSSPDYRGTSGSPTIGVDYRVTDGLVVGALFNYTRGNVDFADGSNLDTDTELGALYADWTSGHWFVDGLVGYGHTDYDQNRTTLAGSQANASPDGDEVLATLDGGYDFHVGGWTVSPQIGAQYTRLTKDSFSESGGGAFNLNVGEQDIDSLRSKVGFHATRTFKVGFAKLIPQFNATWYHELLDDTNSVNNSLPGAPALGSFVVTTTPQGRDFALVGAGLTAVPNSWHDNVSVFLNYDAQVGQNDFLSHTVNGGVRVNF